MDLSPSFTHSTYNVSSLVLIALVGCALVCLLRLIGGRKPAAVAATVVTAALIFLAGAHIPIVSMIAPRTFCFGDIGVVHLLCFACPGMCALLPRKRTVA